MTELRGIRLVADSGLIEHGYVRVDGDRIAEVGQAPAPAVHDGQWVLPGFVDMHVHGGGGASFTTGDPDEAVAAAAFHLRHGTTTLLASLVTAPFPGILAAVEALAPLVRAGTLAGIHLEGPYLSHARCGAQNPAHLRPPDVSELETLLRAGQGAVRMVTVAPELPGALEAIHFLVRRGVVAAIGHTDASYEQTLRAIQAGATVGTHVFNGMRAPHHRDPGPVFALLGAAGVSCELVADGHHLHDGTLAYATATLGADRAVLVTDAMAAAGMPDGQFELGGQTVAVRGGVARLSGERDGAIAGSTLTMDAALRRTVQVGQSVHAGARMAATTPARALRLPASIGSLRAGARADLVVLDEELSVVRVMRGGAWLE